MADDILATSAAQALLMEELSSPDFLTWTSAGTTVRALTCALLRQISATTKSRSRLDRSEGQLDEIGYGSGWVFR